MRASVTVGLLAHPDPRALVGVRDGPRYRARSRPTSLLIGWFLLVLYGLRVGRAQFAVVWSATPELVATEPGTDWPFRSAFAAIPVEARSEARRLGPAGGFATCRP